MNTCATCMHPYRDAQQIERCRISGSIAELEAITNNHAENGCNHFEPVENLMPVIAQMRWEEETRRNRYTGWRSLAQFCASVAINAEIANPHSRLADLMAAKAKQAHQNMLALRPEADHADA